MGQDDLFGALEEKLGHSDLIKNILSMQWNIEVQPTSNYSLGMALMSTSKLGHDNLIGDMVVRV